MLFQIIRDFMSLLLKLPKDSYVEHHRFQQDNQGAADWVKALHYMQSDEMRKRIKKKYLISDWLSAAGYEVPSVIFVTRDLDKPWNATHCQRAKAKLVVYKMPEAPEASYYPASDSGSSLSSGSESEMAQGEENVLYKVEGKGGIGTSDLEDSFPELKRIQKPRIKKKKTKKLKKKHSSSSSSIDRLWQSKIDDLEKVLEQMVSTSNVVQQATENLEQMITSMQETANREEIKSLTTLYGLGATVLQTKCQRSNLSIKALAKVINEMRDEQTSDELSDSQLDIPPYG